MTIDESAGGFIRRATEAFTRNLAHEEGSIILTQLNDLIKDELIVVEKGEQQLIRDDATGQVKFSRQIRLRLRYQEAYDQMKQERDAAMRALVFIKGALAEWEAAHASD